MKRISIVLVTMVLISFAANGLALAGDTDHKTSKDKQAKIGEATPLFTLADYDGKEYSLQDFQGKYVVLEWTNMDCPFVKKHYKSGNMQKLQKKYAQEGVVWLRVCSSAPGQQGHFEAKMIANRIKTDKAMAAAYLIDEKGTVGRIYAAKTTPHMFVIDPKGVLIYAGGIDDKPSTNTADIDGATNYVSQCLDAAMNGEPVKTKTSTPYGCAVKYAKK
ncbi:MAG: redoxin domain-containing protein [Candidatus Krumholzibacteria bacterium]|nr:redoxin domain-containing protein [Candidatus Krumholzibacteria bacterium]